MIRSIADLQQMKEAYLEKMGQYTHLCMVCYGTGCMSSGCKNVRDAMVEELEKAGLSDKVAVIERGCMGPVRWALWSTSCPMRLITRR